MNRIGAVDWTIGKLIYIILLIVVVVMVLFGWGRMGPMWDNIEMRYDEVKILFGMGEGIYADCYEVGIEDLNGGKDFLRSVGVDKGKFEICRDNVCEMEVGEDKYRIVNGKVDRFVGDKWVSYFDFSDRVLVGKRDWERFSAGVKFLRDNGVEGIYDSGFTKRFVLFGDGSGFNNNITAVWQNGEWAVQENGKGVNYFWDDEKAIRAFAAVVSGGYDDKVSWKIGDVKMKDVQYKEDKNTFALGTVQDNVCQAFCQNSYSYREDGFDSGFDCSGKLRNGGLCCCYGDEFGFDVIGDVGFDVGVSVGDLIGGNDEIDNEDEVLALIDKFREIKVGLLGEAGISEGNLGKMRSLVGKKVVVGGKEHVVSLDESGDFPIVVFGDKAEGFVLKFGPFVKTRSSLFERVRLESFPVYFGYYKGVKFVKSGDDEVYRLSKEKFDEVSKEGVGAKFLRGRCK